MLDALKKFENKKPEIVFEWNDPETGAEGWIVINSLRGGAAGGGTRMRKGLDRHEVTSLAKTMEIKFSVAGPDIGGAKSGINFDPGDPRKREVLERWFAAAIPILKQYYGTGGDLNVDEIHDVIDITKRYGLLHPQEGVVNGHLGRDEKLKKNKIHRLQEGVVLPVTNPALAAPTQKTYTVADMITGYGVSESVIHAYRLNGIPVKDKRVVIQGWGNVGAAAGLYLAKAGAKITGIIDRHGGVLNPDGFSYENIARLFANREGNQLRSENIISFEELNTSIWKQGFEVFIPAAASRLITKEQVDIMCANGLEMISCGANVPFNDQEIFFGPTGKHADAKVTLIPDFISNCGMARVFAFLMTSDAAVTDANIFNDVSSTIGNALEAIYHRNNSGKNVSATAFEIALEKLN